MTAKQDLSDTLRQLGLGLIDTAQGRLALLQADLAAELDRLGSLLARQILVALSGFLTVQFLALVLLAIVWDTRWRVTAMAVLALLAAGVAVLAYRKYQAEKHKPTPIFAATIRELEEDRRLMERESK